MAGMPFLKSICLFGFSFGVAFCAVCFANAQEVSFVSDPVWLSTSRAMEGETVIASTVITKSSTDAVQGSVEFFANDASIGTTEFSLPSDVGGAVASVSFVPRPGTHRISAKVTRAVIARESGEETVTVAGAPAAAETLTIEPDNDRDRIADASDPDDDNDDVSDADEKTNGTDPMKKETSEPTVAGTSTVSLAGAGERAKDVGAKVFAQTETLRASMANYFDRKIAQAEAEKEAKQAAARDEQDIEEKLAHPKPLTEQLQDTSGLFERFKIQLFSIGSFFTDNVYAFYILGMLIVLGILRAIWRRHSLD